MIQIEDNRLRNCSPLDDRETFRDGEDTTRDVGHEKNGVSHESMPRTFTPPPPPDREASAVPLVEQIVPSFCNYDECTVIDNSKERVIRVGVPLPELGRRLNELTGGWPKRVGSQLFVQTVGPSPLWLDDANGLIAWIARHLPEGGANRLQFARGADMHTPGRLLAYCQQVSEDFDAVEAFPHEPHIPRHYYLHPPLAGGDGRALQRFLDRFCPATPEDRELICGFLATLVWGGPLGQRPAFLFTAQDRDAEGGRGVGKSTLPQIAAQLVGGYLEVDKGDNFPSIKTRLLSSEGGSKRILMLDNLKTLRLSNEDIEKLITSPRISGKALYVGEGQRPNTLTVALTINGASLSKDLSQRSIPITLARPTFSANWLTDTQALIDSDRWEIISDLLRLLRQPAVPLSGSSRWGLWEREILGRLSNPDRLQHLIVERQADIDTDKAEADEVRDAIIRALESQGCSPENGPYFMSSMDLSKILSEVLAETISATSVTPRLRAFSISEMRISKYNGKVRGWRWDGASAKGDLTVVTFGTRPHPTE